MNTLQLFINQRLWKEVNTTVDANGNYDFAPAIAEITKAQQSSDFLQFAVRQPLDLVSI